MAVYLYALFFISIVGLGVDVQARGIHEEPSCSQFDFLEKLLNKQIRIDHSIEGFEHKLSKWEDRIEKMLTKLEKSEQQMAIGASEIRDEKSNIEVAMAALGKQQERMTQDLFDQQKENNETLLQSVKNMKESLTTSTIAFKIRQVSDLTPSAGDHMIYTVPVVNVGGGYDTKTGEYTIPRDGLYMFTVQVCTQSNEWLNLQIMAAGQILEAPSHQDSHTGSCTSGSGVAILSTGDKVWIKCRNASSGNVISQNSEHEWNTFSGILIN